MKVIEKCKKIIENLSVLDVEKDKLVRIEVDEISRKKIFSLRIIELLGLIISLYITYNAIVMFIKCNSIINTINSLKCEFAILSVLIIIIFIIMLTISFSVMMVTRESICIIKEYLICNEKIIININNKEDRFYLKKIDTKTEFIKKGKYSLKELNLLSKSVDNLLKYADRTKFKIKDILFNILNTMISTGTLIGIYKLIWKEKSNVENVMKLKRSISYSCFKLNLEIIIAFIFLVFIQIFLIYFFIVLKKYIRDVSYKRIRILERLKTEMES